MPLSLQPSAAHRWLTCTASPGYIAEHEDKLPKEDSSYANEGTQAHDVAEKMLRGQDWSCPPDMAEHVKGYVERVRANKATASETAELYIEARVPLFYMPGRNGRIDTAIIDKANNELIVRDLKYGQGVMVDAEGNEQQAIYAESLIRDVWKDMPGDATVRIIIDQPRARDGDTVKDWALTRAELSAFVSRIGAVARKIIANEGVEFVCSDETCRFCPAAQGWRDDEGTLHFCPGKAKEALAGLEALPEPVAAPAGLIIPDPSTLTQDQLRRIVDAEPQLVAFLESAKAFVFRTLDDGGSFPGYKLVEGKSNRAWVDEGLAAKKLAPFVGKENLYGEPKFITPAQAEKLLKKPLKEVTTRLRNALDQLIVKPEGKPVLAPESDPRPAIVKNPLAGLVDESIL